MSNLFKQIFTWWNKQTLGTFIYTLIKGKFVGEDQFGNKYYSDSNDKKFQLLEEIYNKQKYWAVGSDINKINDLIKDVGLNFDLTEEKMDSCLKDDKSQDEILEQRIDAQKKYKIESTPTILVNEKKYENKTDYNSFKKIIDKNL